MEVDMKVIRAADRMRGDVRPPVGRFHGNASQHLVHQTSGETRESFVHFEPGAHTHWHVHSGGQLLHIVEGRARIQAWGGDLESLDAGDTAIAPPGEKHWHGAAADAPLTQLAITTGEVTWLEDVKT
jgi:quercetin dioxygenase-like cupin family protein